MRIYRIYRTDKGGYDTFSDAVVVAESEEQARRMHPSFEPMDPNVTYIGDGTVDAFASWPDDPAHVMVEDLGQASYGIIVPHVVCSSFHAG